MGSENTRGVCNLGGKEDEQAGSSNMMEVWEGSAERAMGTHTDAPGPTRGRLGEPLEKVTSQARQEV